MRFLQLSEMCEVIFLNDDTTMVVDNSNLKYLKFNNRNDLKSLLELFQPTKRYIEYDLNQISSYCNISSHKADNLIQDLIKLNILKIKEISANKMKDLHLTPFLESSIDKRFGQQILSLEKISQKELNGFEALDKIKDIKISIIGAGALGSQMAVLLSALGVKDITVFDEDRVELGNLTRQIYYNAKQAENKTLKVEALESFIKEFYPESNIKGIPHFLTNINELREHIEKDTNIIIQTADFPQGLLDRYVNQVCVEYGIACMYSHHLTIGPFYIPGESACFSCMEKMLNDKTNGMHEIYIQSLANTPNYPKGSLVTGMLQSSYYILMEIINYICLNDKIQTKNAFIRLPSLYDSVEIVKFEQDKNCECSLNTNK